MAEDPDHLLNTFSNVSNDGLGLVSSLCYEVKTDSTEKYAAHTRGDTPFCIEKTAETKYFIDRGGNDSF